MVGKIMSEVVDLLPEIDVTPSAREHFRYLIEKEEVEGMNLRVFLDQPGLPTADIGICFCPPGEQRANDLVMDLEVFKLYIDRASASYLEDAKIDYLNDKMGGQLSITAPNLKGPRPDAESSLADQLQYVLQTEVNPNLAGHGGMVTLVEVTEDNDVVLRFGGGCHGCGMVDVTLKDGIERTLKEKFPEIARVVDVTDHSSGENPYY
ncbi:MAG: NifU family protein [Candidatus Berkiella sp.]